MHTMGEVNERAASQTNSMTTLYKYRCSQDNIRVVSSMYFS